ncbi:hypothetical protein TRVL_05211 [Trypanosoma vivax]|nr:hypothetical protein TRVL_05211 [Trypanosoma vivax]
MPKEYASAQVEHNKGSKSQLQVKGSAHQIDNQVRNVLHSTRPQSSANSGRLRTAENNNRKPLVGTPGKYTTNAPFIPEFGKGPDNRQNPRARTFPRGSPRFNLLD